MAGWPLDALVWAHGLVWKVQHILCEHGRVEAGFYCFLIFQAPSNVEQVVFLIPLEVTPHFIISWARWEALSSLNRPLWVVHLRFNRRSYLQFALNTWVQRPWRVVKGVTFHVFVCRKQIQTLLIQVIDLLVIPGPWILKRDYTVRKMMAYCAGNEEMLHSGMGHPWNSIFDSST
jgi:hypothetical protein